MRSITKNTWGDYNIRYIYSKLIPLILLPLHLKKTIFAWITLHKYRS